MSTIRDNGSGISSGIDTADTSNTIRGNGDDIPSGLPLSGSGNIPSDSSSPIHIGSTINPGDTLILNSASYQFLKALSKSSGEAEIFLLEQGGKKCILKLYYPNFKPKEDIVKQIKMITHAGIINLLDFGYHHDRFFEVMDFAEGGTLDQYLPIKDQTRISGIIFEIIDALQYCHHSGIIHKDIKPQNIYCKKNDGSDVVIGDFGISSILGGDMSRHLTSQSLTVGYAAPEMYGIDGKSYVGKEVDYYALGITIINIWDGKNPFDDLSIHAISNLTTSGKVHIPADIPIEIQSLIKGLITVDYTKRWGYKEVKRWLNGEDVPHHFQVKDINYPPYVFGTNASASTPEELSALLKKNFEKGKKHLYSGKLSAWVNIFNQGLAVELDRVVEDDYPLAQATGLQKVIYLLNPDEAFEQDGKKFKTANELADALEENFTQNTTELLDVNHPFYLYLEAHEAEDEADTFRKYFSTFSGKKALNTIILELRGKDRLFLNGVIVNSPDELLSCFDKQLLANQFSDPESLPSLWLEGSSFNGEKIKINKWRELDKEDQNDSTILYALNDNDKFTPSTHNRAHAYYELAQCIAVNSGDLQTSLLEKCLDSKGGDACFDKIASYKHFEDYKDKINNLLFDSFNRKVIDYDPDSSNSTANLQEIWNQSVILSKIKGGEWLVSVRDIYEEALTKAKELDQKLQSQITGLKPVSEKGLLGYIVNLSKTSFEGLEERKSKLIRERGISAFKIINIFLNSYSKPEVAGACWVIQIQHDKIVAKGKPLFRKKRRQRIGQVLLVLCLVTGLVFSIKPIIKYREKQSVTNDRSDTIIDYYKKASGPKDLTILLQRAFYYYSKYSTKFLLTELPHSEDDLNLKIYQEKASKSGSSDTHKDIVKDATRHYIFSLPKLKGEAEQIRHEAVEQLWEMGLNAKIDESLTNIEDFSHLHPAYFLSAFARNVNKVEECKASFKVEDTAIGMGIHNGAYCDIDGVSVGVHTNWNFDKYGVNLKPVKQNVFWIKMLGGSKEKASSGLTVEIDNLASQLLKIMFKNRSLQDGKDVSNKDIKNAVKFKKCSKGGAYNIWSLGCYPDD